MKKGARGDARVRFLCEIPHPLLVRFNVESMRPVSFSPLMCYNQGMRSVKFCVHCGGLLEKGFLFCPYCGSELAEKPSVARVIGPPLEKLAQTAAKSRLDNCRLALDTMEKELNDFLTTALNSP